VAGVCGAASVGGGRGAARVNGAAGAVSPPSVAQALAFQPLQSQVVALHADFCQVRSAPLQWQHEGLGGVVETFVQALGHVSLSCVVALGVGLALGAGLRGWVAVRGVGAGSATGAGGGLSEPWQANRSVTAIQRHTGCIFFIVVAIRRCPRGA